METSVPKQEEKQLLIKQSAAQAILDFLAKEPYVKVHQLAPLLMNLKEGQELSPKTETPPENNQE